MEMVSKLSKLKGVVESRNCAFLRLAHESVFLRGSQRCGEPASDMIMIIMIFTCVCIAPNSLQNMFAYRIAFGPGGYISSSVGARNPLLQKTEARRVRSRVKVF